MAILEILIDALGAITPEQIAQAGAALEAPEEGDVRLGVVTSARTQALWTLAQKYDRESIMLAVAARFDSKTDDERNAFRKLGASMAALEEIARDLCWAEVRAELDVWDSENVGLRTGFTVVSTAGVPRPRLEIHPIDIMGMIESVRRMRNVMHTPEEPPKGKPQ